jgi:hypothetical protein
MASYTSKQYQTYDASTGLYSGYFWSSLSTIPTMMANMHWLQKPDTSQMMWNGMTLTQVASGSGIPVANSWVYTYTSLTGPALVAGRALTITGMTNGNNNGTFPITAIGTGTFTVTNANGAAEGPGSTGAVTIGTIPAAGSWVSEVWGPSDALQTGASIFYVRIDYGVGTAATAGPRLRMALGTGTTGACVLSGYYTSNLEPSDATSITGGGVATSDCYYSGDTNRMGMTLWRSQAGNRAPLIFVIERTHDTNGNDTADGVTLVATGDNGAAILEANQTLGLTGAGAAPATSDKILLALGNGVNASSLYNNNIPVSVMFPEYGIYGNPLTGVVFLHTQDAVAGSLITANFYGATRTYIISTTAQTPASMTTGMRYD